MAFFKHALPCLASSVLALRIGGRSWLRPPAFVSELEAMQAKAKKYNPGKKRGTISSESVVVTDGYVPPSYPKTPEEVTDLIGQLKQLFFTQSLSRKELRTLAAAFKKVEVQPGERAGASTVLAG